MHFFLFLISKKKKQMMSSSMIQLICSVLILICSVYIMLNSGSEENYSFDETQYIVKYPNALENQPFKATPYECTKLCSQYNTGVEDRVRCMDECNLNSGFIPTLNMIPNGDTLYYQL